eukprot:gene16840-18539_t
MFKHHRMSLMGRTDLVAAGLGDIKSLECRELLTVNFRNLNEFPVKLHWIDYNGNTKLYCALKQTTASSDGFCMQTFLTHPWFATDMKCKEIMTINFQKVFRPISSNDSVDLINQEELTESVDAYITPTIFKLEELCSIKICKLMSEEEIRKVEIPPSIADNILSIRPILNELQRPIMKDKSSVDQQNERKSISKKKKSPIEDPKQRKLSFAKCPPVSKKDQEMVISSDSDSDEPLSVIKKTLNSPSVEKNIISKKNSPSAKKLTSSKDKQSLSPSKKGKEKNELSQIKKSTPKSQIVNGKTKDVMQVLSDSDSELDIPLSKLKDSPNFKIKTPSKKPIFTDRSNSAKVLKSLATSDRSPKVKISCAKSPKIKNKAGVDFKQRTLFDFGAQAVRDPLVFQVQFVKPIDGNLASKSIAESSLKPKVDWKNLTDEEREKIRQQKREEWNRLRRERNKTKNQKFDDLELTNIPELPAAKPIVMPEGIPNSAFGDIAMLVEFCYTFNKFLAPEDSPTITAELLMKALAAGSQGAGIVSKMLLILLRALIGEEEREVNGLGIGLADMPITAFTVSDLIFHYLKFTSEEGTGNAEASKDDNDDASSVESEEDDDTKLTVSYMTVPQRIIKSIENEEFFKLSAADQLRVLMFLFHKIIDSEYFVEYLENLKMESKELWRQQDAFSKKIAKEKKDEGGKKDEAQKPAVTLDKFGAKVATSKDTPAAIDSKEATDTVGADHNAPADEVSENKTDGDQLVAEKKEAKEHQDAKKQEAKTEAQEINITDDDKLMKDYPKEPVADLVHVIRQRRIMVAKQAAMKDEEERKEKERRKMMDELQQKMRKMQAWRDGLEKCKKSLRLEPLGVDRHFKLYWVFSGGMPGIYVEDGWMYHAGEHRTIDSWECYDTVEDVEKLMKNLAWQGVRESVLKSELSNHYKSILNGIKKKNIDHFELKPYDVFEESLKVLKEDMIESGVRIVRGVLGIIANHENWEKQVKEARTLEEIVPLVLELQQGILLKYLEGPMDQSKGEKIVQTWQENVKQVKTLSALHTLLGILENSVKWDKSAEHARCKICRKKAGDDYLVLCDECNRGYHPYCLRPALLDIPFDNWKCPACEPLKATPRASRSTRRATADEPEEASSEEEGEELDDEEAEEIESDHESLCHVCGEDGELICCDQCPKVYHLDCHEPPIRRLPRGMWICFICRNPKAFTRSQKRNGREKATKSKSSKNTRGRGKAAGRRGRRSARESEDDNSDVEGQEEGESENEEDDEEEQVRETKRSTRNQRQTRTNLRRSNVSTEESEEEGDKDEEEEELEDDEEGRTRSTRSKKVSNTREAKKKGTRTKASKGKTKTRQAVEESDDIVACEDILRGVWKDENSYPFRNPVDLKKVPDYINYVKNPIDLSTIRDKLDMLEYEDAFQFLEDVKLIFSNSKLYNEDTSQVGQAALQLKSMFYNLVKEYLPGLHSTLCNSS